MPKKRWKKVDEEEKRLKEEEARKKRQEMFERCLQCRFFESISEGDAIKKRCMNREMRGRLSDSDVCPGFVRRWPVGINPVDLLE
jgi:hypothetical protein